MKIGIRLTGQMTRLPLEENARWAAEHGFADVLSEAGYQGPLNIEHEDQVWGFTRDVERTREGLLLARRYLEQATG